MARVPTDSGTLEVLADSGTSEAQADAGTPEIEVDAGTPEIEVDAGKPEIEVDAGTPEAQADAGTPEIEVDAGTPAIEVDAGTGPSEMDAGVVLPFCGDGITDSDNGEDCDDGNDIDYDSCTNSCNYGKVIIYDPLVPFLPIQTGSLLYSGGTLATEFTTSFASELVSVDYFVFANENLSFRVDVLDVTNASPDSLWSETHTDVNECRDWCRCRFTLTNEVSGLQCTSMATNAGIYNFGDVAPMAGNGINLSNASTYEIKSTYESESSGTSVLFRAFDPSQTQATADPSYKTGDGSDARTVTSRRVQSSGDNEFCKIKCSHTSSSPDGSKH